ncbi:MAG: spore coat U domain-containing protein [Gammaproteobacteria bacterium]
MNRRSTLAGALALAPVLAGAGQASTDFTVSMVIEQACTITAANLDFGTVLNLPEQTATANASLTVNCPEGLPYNIALDVGRNPGGDEHLATRNMVNADGVEVTYDIYQDAALTQSWGDVGFGSTNPCGSCEAKAAIGSGTDQVHTMFGETQVPFDGGTPGSYADTVTASVHF